MQIMCIIGTDIESCLICPWYDPIFKKELYYLHNDKRIIRKDHKRMETVKYQELDCMKVTT